MKQILLMTSYASPYKVQFFNELGALCSLTVIFTQEIGSQKHRSADWFVQSKLNFQAVQLKESRIRVGGKPYCFGWKRWLRQKYDRIIISGYGNPTEVAAIAWLKRHRRDYDLEVDGGLVRQDAGLRKKIKTVIISGASGYLSSGPAATRYLVHYGADPEKVTEYPFSSLRAEEIPEAPATVEQKKVLRRKLGMTEQKIVLSVGQFIHRKGYDILCRSASQLSDNVGIYIVGGEPTEEYLQLQRELGLNHVHFVGFCPHDALKEYYQAADLFVLPTREDIWGLVINEAMAWGLPVITTDRCGAGLDLVTDGVNGYIVPVGDVAALTNRMRQILQEDSGRMGVASLERIRPYTIENMAAAHAALAQTAYPGR